jgi:hypothetical protein
LNTPIDEPWPLGDAEAMTRMSLNAVPLCLMGGMRLEVQTQCHGSELVFSIDSERPGSGKGSKLAKAKEQHCCHGV